MKKKPRNVVCFGDFVVAAFDMAKKHCADKSEISQFVLKAVNDLLSLSPKMFEPKRPIKMESYIRHVPFRDRIPVKILFSAQNYSSTPSLFARMRRDTQYKV